MTNAEGMIKMTNVEDATGCCLRSFVLRHYFVIRHSEFVISECLDFARHDTKVSHATESTTAQTSAADTYATSGTVAAQSAAGSAGGKVTTLFRWRK